MPRTKMVRKKSSIAKKSMMSSHSGTSLNSTAGSSCLSADMSAILSQTYENLQELQDAINAYYDAMIAKIKEEYKQAAEQQKSLIQRDFNGLPGSVRNARFHQAVEEATVGSARRLRRSRSSEELEFKKPETPPAMPPPKNTSRQRSRSATPASRDGFKTPTSFRRLVAGSTITPKVYNDAPITMMRRPMQGEMAVSVTGSPLMVSAVTSEEVPTVNVPLMDGRVFSIMPEAGDAPFDLPQFDEVTRQHLKTLRDHLTKLAPDSPPRKAH